MDCLLLSCSQDTSYKPANQSQTLFTEIVEEEEEMSKSLEFLHLRLCLQLASVLDDKVTRGQYIFVNFMCVLKITS